MTNGDPKQYLCVYWTDEYGGHNIEIPLAWAFQDMIGANYSHTANVTAIIIELVRRYTKHIGHKYMMDYSQELVWEVDE